MWWSFLLFIVGRGVAGEWFFPEPSVYRMPGGRMASSLARRQECTKISLGYGNAMTADQKSRRTGRQALVWVRLVSRTAVMTRPLTRSGNQTGENQGTGIRNSTSESVIATGHRMVAHKPA